MIRKALIAATILSGVCGRAYAESVTLDVTSPFMFQDTISVQYYVDAGPTCDTIEGSVSGSSGYYHEFGASGVSYLSGGDTDYLADTSVPNEIDYTLDASGHTGISNHVDFRHLAQITPQHGPRTPFSRRRRSLALTRCGGLTVRTHPVMQLLLC